MPSILYNMLAWTCGLSENPSDQKVDVSKELNRRILSIGQDILFLANPRSPTSKHFLLRTAVKQITGSKRVIDILHVLGHSAAYSTIQRLETDIAEFQLLRPVPSTLHCQQFTTLIWDNIDFLEETVSGSNTTHCVNGIAIQTVGDEWITQAEDEATQVSFERKRRKTLQMMPLAVNRDIIKPKRKYPVISYGTSHVLQSSDVFDRARQEEDEICR